MYAFISSRPSWAVGSELETLWGSAVAMGIKLDCAELLESEFATRAWIGEKHSSRDVVTVSNLYHTSVCSYCRQGSQESDSGKVQRC
jgi:hypothetical protein